VSEGKAQPNASVGDMNEEWVSGFPWEEGWLGPTGTDGFLLPGSSFCKRRWVAVK
jgi:hypothetical protein